MDHTEPLSVCQSFHEETKYAVDRMDRFSIPPNTPGPPVPFKHYHTEQAVDLVGYLPFEQHPFTGGPLPDVREPLERPSLEELSHLLFFTNGITAQMKMPDGSRHFFRAAPSAGALYPTEIYVAVHDFPGLKNGIYNYLVENHSLVPMWDEDCWDALCAATFQHSAMVQANLSLIFTGLWERGAWRYRERAYRRILLDTGHILGNLNLMGPQLGFGVFPIGGFVDSAINARLFLDDAEEGALSVVALPALDVLTMETVPNSASYPSPTLYGETPEAGIALIPQLHRAAYLPADELTPEPAPLPEPEALEDPYRDAEEVIALDHAEIDWEGSLEAAILHRRSARAYEPGTLSLDMLGAILSHAYQPAVPFRRGPEGNVLHQMFDPSLLHTYLLINTVEEMVPGVYYYGPLRHELRLVRPGDVGDTAEHICLGQELGAHAALLVIHTANLEQAVERYGERAYRYLHMDAGHIGERMNLAARSFDLGASGIGGFYDDDVTRTLGLSGQEAVAYITTIGVPRGAASA
ncbi:MAG: SagB/ThcOx family dehydrogenase [Leptospirillia bacterium]